MSLPRQKRAFVTETLGEPIPIIIFGADSRLKQAVIGQIGKKHPEFIGFSDQQISSSQELLPYRVIWIMSDEEDWEGALAYAQYARTPFVAVVFGKNGEEVSKAVVKKHPETMRFLFSQHPSVGDEQKVASLIVEELFFERRSGVEKRLLFTPEPIWQEEKVERVERYVSPPTYSQKTHQEQSEILHILTPTGLEESKGLRETEQEEGPLMPVQLYGTRERPRTEIRHAPTITPAKLFSHLPEERVFIEDQFGIKRSHDDIDRKKKDETHIPDTLRQIFQQETKAPVKERVSGFRKTSQERAKEQSILKKVGSLIVICVFVALLPILGYFASRMMFVRQAQSVFLALSGDSSQLAGVDQKALTKNIEFFQIYLRVADAVLTPVGFSQSLEKGKEIMALVQKGGTAIQSSQKLKEIMVRAYAASVRGSGDDPLELLDQASTQVEQTSKDLALFSAELGSIPEEIPLISSMKTRDLEKSTSVVRKNLVKTQHLLSVLPSILGEQQKKTYLVLIQNPLELRPSGGFLESYALITIDKGRVLDIQVQDVMEADNLLKGRVDPPTDLQQHLGESQWYFRDSNWSVQFPTNAQQAEWFLQKELGRSVDGVIALNAYLIRDLLKITGPITLTSQDRQQITADNIMERLFTRSETLLPSQQTKKVLLSSISEVLFAELQKLREEQVFQVSGVFFQALERGEVFMSVKGRAEQDTLALLGLTGSALTPPCPQVFSENTCVVDTMYQVDANVGVNRANYSIQRIIEHNVVLSQSTAAHTYSIQYTNTALSAAWPSGTYKNYVRLVLPDFTQLNSVVLDDKPLSSSVVTQNIQHGKREVGFEVDVPVGKTVKVKVNYVSLLSVPAKFSYALFTQRQAGTQDDPISFSINAQKPLRVTKIAPEGAVLGNVVQFDSTLDRHQYLAVEVQ
ncbi:MAG TPA: DUF4012 domain-containing protein [Patescibacteria group bacterium]|nr:DUF4012 domain-containing protein [Patescibacteria group bacterium]